jgi:hypothetical protein
VNRLDQHEYVIWWKELTARALSPMISIVSQRKELRVGASIIPLLSIVSQNIITLPFPFSIINKEQTFLYYS